MSPTNAVISLLAVALSVACASRVDEAPARAPASSLRSALRDTSPAHDAASVDAPSGKPEPRVTPLRQVLACSTRPCIAPKGVVLKLCGGKNPDVAVSLFASDSPLERRYVRMQEIDAMNTLGGPSSGDKLVFDEEVIMLDGSSPSPSELSVSGANGHHVLRLDGTCATVMDDELTATRPPAPRYAQLTWGHLDASIQDALLVDPNVKAKRRAFRTACYASFRPRADPRCDNARQALADAVVKAIHAPISLPDVMVNAM